MIDSFVRFIFLSSIILLFNGKIITGLAILLLSIIIYIKQKCFSRKFIIVFACELSLILFILIFNKINIDFKHYLTGLVIEKHNNYIVLFNGFEKVYVYLKDTKVDIFDIIRFNGNFETYYFSTLESEFDFNQYLRLKGINNQLKYLNYDLILDFPININCIKDNIINNFDNEYSKFLIDLLLFGRQNNINFNNALYNIISIFSGTGIYLFFTKKVLFKLFYLKFNEKNSEIASILILIPYIFLNITRISILRFLILNIFNLINKYKLNKRFNYFHTLNLLNITLILVNPFNLFNQGFYITTIISYFLYFSKLFLKKYNRIKLKILRKVLIFMLILPFNIRNNNSINLLTIVIQFASHELLKPIFFVSLLFIFIKPFNFVSIILGEITEFIFNLNYKYLTIAIPKFSEIYIVLYYLMFILIIYFKEVNFKIISNKILLVSTLFGMVYISPITNLNVAKVSFINVGQGDSILVQNRFTNVLIDTGGLNNKDIATECLIPYLRKNKIYKIDAVFISHNDFDHSGSLANLDENFIINDIYTYNDSYPINVGKIYFNNLNSYWNINSEENDKSLVLNFSIANVNFLLMGDAPKYIEDFIIKDNPKLKCDILKVGHHGSSSSSSEEFIKKISPKEAVISCGLNNKYHHPHDEVIDVLNKYNVTIRRTDIEGTIEYKFIL